MRILVAGELWNCGMEKLPLLYISINYLHVSEITVTPNAAYRDMCLEKNRQLLVARNFFVMPLAAKDLQIMRNQGVKGLLNRKTFHLPVAVSYRFVRCELFFIIIASFDTIIKQRSLKSSDRKCDNCIIRVIRYESDPEPLSFFWIFHPLNCGMTTTQSQIWKSKLYKFIPLLLFVLCQFVSTQY